MPREPQATPKTPVDPRRRKTAAKQPFPITTLAPDHSPQPIEQEVRAKHPENPLHKRYYNNAVAPGLRVGRGLELVRIS